MEDNVEMNVERQPVVSIQGGEVFANSRDVAAFFGKRHDDVLRAIGGLLAAEPNLCLRNFTETSVLVEMPQGGTRPSRAFNMNRDGFTLMAMGFTGNTALKWKLRYIEAFNALEAELRNQPAVDPMKMLNDPSSMRGLLLNYADKVLVLEGEKAALQPKADALARIAESDGSLCITDAAKTLQVRPNDLFKFLRAHSWIYRRPSTDHDVAYQSKLMTGLLEHKTTTVHRSDGSEKITTQVRVMPKGLTRLAQEFPAHLRAA
jgi:Rha family phage regulatory protein